MIVVAIIALLAAIAVPSAMRARKRAQATSTLETCRTVDHALETYIIEHPTNMMGSYFYIDYYELAGYIKKDTALYNDIIMWNPRDAEGNWINLWVDPNQHVVVTIDYRTYQDLQSVADDQFWGEYGPFSFGG